MDVEVIAGIVSFAALIIVWAFAPSKPTHEMTVESVAAPARSEVLA
jgi:hypothetical protein